MIDSKENIKVWQRLVSSSTGAVVTSVLVTPLDVVKIRMQAQKKPMMNGNCFIYCNGLMDHVYQCVNGTSKFTTSIPLYKKNIYFNSSFDAIQKIIKSEGILSLWNGLSPSLILAIPQVVIYYTLNDWLKYVMGYNSYKFAVLKPLSLNSSAFTRDDLIPPFCAAVARCIAQTTIAPLELIRTKMQSKKLTYSEIHKITSLAIQQNGVSVLWRGLGPTMWRDLPYTVTLWFIYEYLKKGHPTNLTDQSFPYHLILMYSAIGAVAAGLISHPFDVTKTHRQIELGNAASHNRKISSSTWAYLITLKKSEGYGSLFSGFIPRMVRVVVATTTMITIFESIKSFFIKYNTTKDLQRNSFNKLS